MHQTQFTIFLIVVLVAVGVYFITWRKKMADDFTALNATVAKLSTSVDALIASKAVSNQPAIDSVTAAVEGINAKVVAATSVTPPSA